MDEPEQSFDGLTSNSHEDVNNNNSILECPNLSSEDRQFLEMFNYWIGGVVISCVAVPGLMMNLVAICVLLRSVSNRNNFNPLIVILCIFDSAFLALELMDVLRKYFNAESIVLILLFPKFIYPLREIVFTSSIFMTVAIAYERYSAITFPFQHLQLLRSRKCRRMALIKYILVVSATAIIFNIPKFFETQVEWKNVNDINLPNQTTTSENISSYLKDENDGYPSTPYITITELRKNPTYSIYYINLAVLFILGIIPVIFLGYFNFIIYINIKPPTILSRAEENQGSQISIHPTTPSRCSNHHEKELARVLIGIVIIFIFCHLLRLMINFYETLVIRNAIACESAGRNGFPFSGFIFITLSEILLVINSSMNMIIYCCINGNFRKKVLFWKEYFRSEMAPNRDQVMAEGETIRMNKMDRVSISSEGVAV